MRASSQRDSNPPLPANSNRVWVMKKYEFKSVIVKFSDFDLNNRMALESFKGWEIKAAVESERHATFYLQREITETSGD